MAEGCMNLLLAYPAGFQPHEDGGNINVIRGAHLYCDTAAESPAEASGTGSTANDRAMQEGWLRGKTHPATVSKMAHQFSLPFLVFPLPSSA